MGELRQAPADPYHVASAIQTGKPLCECGELATCKGWFVNLSSTGSPTTNAMLLCDSCAALCDKDVTITRINERPKWESNR